MDVGEAEVSLDLPCVSLQVSLQHANPTVLHELGLRLVESCRAAGPWTWTWASRPGQRRRP